MALYFNGKPVFSESGTKSLPWAEYQALSQTEKNNGTIYFITDVNGDGQSFQPVLFSEEEREVGVWVDGKPLYQKSFILTSSLTITDNWTSTTYSITDIDNIADGIIYRVECRGAIYIDTNVQGSTIYISTKSKNTTFGVGSVLTIRYTKTTDTAGSGTWTPQGVPAHHYSEDEHIVGTWVDGSTLYEKTYYYTSATVPAQSTAVTIADVSSLSIDNNVNIDATYSITHKTNGTLFWFSVRDCQVELENSNLLFMQKATSAPDNYEDMRVNVTLRYTKSST